VLGVERVAYEARIRAVPRVTPGSAT